MGWASRSTKYDKIETLWGRALGAGGRGQAAIYSHRWDVGETEGGRTLVGVNERRLSPTPRRLLRSSYENCFFFFALDGIY